MFSRRDSCLFGWFFFLLYSQKEWNFCFTVWRHHNICNKSLQILQPLEYLIIFFSVFQGKSIPVTVSAMRYFMKKCDMAKVTWLLGIMAQQGVSYLTQLLLIRNKFIWHDHEIISCMGIKKKKLVSYLGEQSEYFPEVYFLFRRQL